MVQTHVAWLRRVVDVCVVKTDMSVVDVCVVGIDVTVVLLAATSTGAAAKASAEGDKATRVRRVCVCLEGGGPWVQCSGCMCVCGC